MLNPLSVLPLSALSSSPSISCSFVTLVHLYCQCLLSVLSFNCLLMTVLSLLKISSILSSISFYFKLCLITFMVFLVFAGWMLVCLCSVSPFLIGLKWYCVCVSFSKGNLCPVSYTRAVFTSSLLYAAILSKFIM